jgi:hypothetical protein
MYQSLTVHTSYLTLINYVTKRIWDKFQNSPNMYSITQDMANLPPFRLKSRKPLWKEEFLMQLFSKSDYWKAAWQEVQLISKL